MFRKARSLFGAQYKSLLTFLRNLSSTEVSTALRPFYFAVHPDLFGKYPEQRQTNEASLQQLSLTLEMLQASRPIKPVGLDFYLKDRSNSQASFKLVKIHLNNNDIRSTILNILKACELSTHYIENKPNASNAGSENDDKIKINLRDIDFTKINKNHPIYATIVMKRKIEEAREALRLKNWLKMNHEDALKKAENDKASIEDIEKLKMAIIEDLGLKDMKWDCGWNITHFRGCLLAFKSLVEQHREAMNILRGRVLVFAQYTGVSLDGDIMLYSGEVRRNWLDFLRKINKHDKTLARIPIFEKTLSLVLRNIKVGRRKFMPKIVAGDYETNLIQITTSLSDYKSRRNFPNEWPESLESYEMVVETEAGPLMVSPTGQFIVPSTIPASLLVNFITDNLEDAKQKANNYRSDKYLERSLKKQCIEELQLSTLLKSDDVTPDIMIKCCKRLLEHKNEIIMYTKGMQLTIATYYSVLSDGVACIPWNFEL